MQLKTKITFILSCLFLVILLLGIIGSQFISTLSNDSASIIKDNYKSLEYMSGMLKALNGMYVIHTEDDVINNTDNSKTKMQNFIALFNNNLEAEEKNITEQGEKEIITTVKQDFFHFLNMLNKSFNKKDSVNLFQLKNKYENLQGSLERIYKMNSDAILIKNNKAAESAHRISLYMIIITICSVIIGISFIYYFPDYILRPVVEMTDRIKAESKGYEERDTAKTNLLATVSHELKTPLSAINLSIKLLEDRRLGNLSEDQLKITGTIKKETSRISKMVNEMLDYSQTESGNIKLNITVTNADEILDFAITSLMILISDKKIELETHIDAHIPKIRADVEKTVWVLVNLINNAVRYTPEYGTLKIACTAEGDYVKFSVTDQGPGIEQENLIKIFDKFVQIGKNPKGRGLGLAIAKEFVTSQSGEIWVESEQGSGSTFYFKLPKA